MALAMVEVRRAEREAATRDIAAVAGYLQETLGQKVTAYLAGVRDPKMVGRWASERVEPRDPVKLRLRCAYQVARMVATAFGAETTRAWLFGTNSRLDDEAPAWVLRHARAPDDLRGVVPAARSFAGSTD